MKKTHGFLVNAFHPKIAASVIYRDRPQVRGNHHPELLKTATHMAPLAGICTNRMMVDLVHLVHLDLIHATLMLHAIFMSDQCDKTRTTT